MTFFSLKVWSSQDDQKPPKLYHMAIPSTSRARRGQKSSWLATPGHATTAWHSEIWQNISWCDWFGRAWLRFSCYSTVLLARCTEQESDLFAFLICRRFVTTMYVFCPAKIYMYKSKLLTINTELRKRPNHFLYIIKSLATNFQKNKAFIASLETESSILWHM